MGPKMGPKRVPKWPFLTLFFTLLPVAHEFANAFLRRPYKPAHPKSQLDHSNLSHGDKTLVLAIPQIASWIPKWPKCPKSHFFGHFWPFLGHFPPVDSGIFVSVKFGIRCRISVGKQHFFAIFGKKMPPFDKLLSKMAILAFLACRLLYAFSW